EASMKTLHKAWLHVVAGVFMLVAPAALAADAPVATPAAGMAASPQSGYPPERDKACTRCHDENDDKPILSIYQTRHGVIADSRTPGCQGCHGTSEDHIRNSKGTSPRPSP